MPIPKKILTYLDTASVRYDVVEHRTVFTAYDLANTLKRKLSDIAKGLVVKADGSYVLVLVPAHHRLDFPKLKKALQAKSVKLANENVQKKVFKVKEGAMTAFGGVHNIPVLVDNALTKTTKMLFGAGSFTESLELKMKDYLKLEDPHVASFSSKAMPESIKVPKQAKKTKRPTTRPKKKRLAAKKKTTRTKR